MVIQLEMSECQLRHTTAPGLTGASCPHIVSDLGELINITQHQAWAQFLHTPRFQALANPMQVLGHTMQVTLTLLWCLITVHDAARCCATLTWQAAKELPFRWSSMPTVQPLTWGLPHPSAHALNSQASLAIREYFNVCRPNFLIIFAF